MTSFIFCVSVAFGAFSKQEKALRIQSCVCPPKYVNNHKPLVSSFLLVIGCAGCAGGTGCVGGVRFIVLREKTSRLQNSQDAAVTEMHAKSERTAAKLVAETGVFVTEKV